MDAPKITNLNSSLSLTNILLILISLLLVGNFIWTSSSMMLIDETSTPVPTVVPTPIPLQVKEWEYKFVRIYDFVEGPFGGYTNSQTDGATTIGLEGNAATLKAINQLGRDGWELVSVVQSSGEIVANLIFKRMLTDK